ncbi:MAG: PASTA domain-containing protein [Actinomycetota bacterium]
MASPAITDLAGRVLAGRYRLLGSVGAGAAGRVYVADDVRLRRRVAVKVLHSGLTEDAAFLRRFRSEAQHAASLHHPHIVAVYDWGEDQGTPFLVLELLRGGSLRALLDAGGRLSPSQAAHVGRQVAQALHHAHTRGVVHRDVKSSNLLFDEHGIVRVADFGLARALAEASWTEPEGVVVGTARYAAPEQASGVAVDGRADCYSLAVVLVEAITGSVPNVGDSPVATVLARSSVPLAVPAGLGALGDVLTRAGQPDPGRRFPDAGAMSAALAAAARELSPPAPFVLPSLGEPADDSEPTQVAPAGPVVAPVPAWVVSGAEPPGAVFDQDTVPLRAGRPPGSYRLVPMVVTAVIVLALAAAAALVASSLGGGGASVAAPNLVGLDEATATSRAEALGLRLAIERRESDDVAGLVIAQRPVAGSFLTGGALRLVVSRGPPPVDVPADLAGVAAADALSRLEQLGFVVRVERAYDETVTAGLVIGTEPALGTKAPRESEIVLRVSDGPAPVPVPAEVVGKTFDEAATILKAKGFGVTRAEVFSDTVGVGKVVGTDPPVGQAAPKGSTITINVSKGPELVTVPTNLVGMTVETASQQLQALGLVPTVENYGPGKRVRATDPVGGTQLKKGSKVTLFL